MIRRCVARGGQQASADQYGTADVVRRGRESSARTSETVRTTECFLKV